MSQRESTQKVPIDIREVNAEIVGIPIKVRTGETRIAEQSKVGLRRDDYQQSEDEGD